VVNVERANNRIVISDYTLAGQTGGARTIIQHLRYFKAFGWEPRLFVSQITPERRTEIDCKIVKVPTLKLGGVVKRVSHAWCADWLARRWKPAIIWGHGDLLRQDVLSLHNCLHLTAERLTGHASTSSHMKLHDRQLTRPDTFRHIIANSRLMKADLIERYRIDAAKITVIYPGYDPAVFGFGDDWRQTLVRRRAALGLDPSHFVVLFATSGAYKKRGVGRFLDGLAGFVAATTAAERQARPVTALLIGKAKEKRLREQVDRRGLASCAQYLATVEHIERFYQCADVLVHSAVIEEFGQIVQEAAICGCPVIASKYVGATELMGAQLADFIMDEPTAEQITERLLEVYRAPSDTVRRAWNDGLSDAMKANTWEHNSRLSHALCLDVLERKSGQVVSG
jgi:UDP-glucose:(heptosyl)LPS alpha-1,3-glucosyltransferase